MSEIIITSEEKLVKVFRKVLKEHEAEKEALTPVKVYTINGAARITRLSHATIKKLVRNGIIKTTRDGKITEPELNNYLKNR